MFWLNYHHLYYFWTVAKEGSIAKASEELLLAQPTISGQIKELERSLGVPLFVRQGRGLALTEAGRLVFGYAEDIFSLGREMVSTLRNRSTAPLVRLQVGVADVLAKPIVYRLLEPAQRLREPVQLICREDTHDRLLASLSLHQLDLVLSDTPVQATVKVRAFSHLLGECGVSFLGAPVLARRYRRGFPQSLAGAPMLLPSSASLLRHSLEQYFEGLGVAPKIVGEFDDSALLKIFGQQGAGLFAAPTVIEKEVRQQYRVALVGRASSVRERFYAISVERKLRHPAVVAISEAARRTIFA